MLLSDLALSTLLRNNEAFLEHNHFNGDLLYALTRALIFQGTSEMTTLDCLEVLVNLCDYDPSCIDLLAQETRLISRFLNILAIKQGAREKEEAILVGNMHSLTLFLLKSFCQHPIFGVAVQEQIMAGIELVVNKVDILNIRTCYLAIELIRQLIKNPTNRSIFEKMKNIMKEIVYIAKFSFINVARNVLIYDGMKMELTMVSALATLAYLSLTSRQLCTLIAEELINATHLGELIHMPTIILEFNGESPEWKASQEAIILIFVDIPNLIN